MTATMSFALASIVGLAMFCAGWFAHAARSGRDTATLNTELVKARAQAAVLQQQAADSRRLDSAITPLSAELRQLTEQVDRAERARVSAQAALEQEVSTFTTTSKDLARETGRLVGALRRSEVRGKWGELQLRQLVDSAGLLEGVHFSEQDSVRTADGLLRPDMIIQLGAGRLVLIDSKTPLDAYLDAELADSDPEREAALDRHAKAVAIQVDQLAAKQYWSHYEGSAEFVVLFLPAEALLAAALTRDPGLLDRSFSKKVVLATPTTLGALLRTVALAWRHEQFADNARQVQQIGAELFARLGVFADHLGKVGQSLDTTVRRYNDAIGSFDSRVTVSARRMADLGVAETTLETPASVTTLPRTPAIVEG